MPVRAAKKTARHTRTAATPARGTRGRPAAKAAAPTRGAQRRATPTKAAPAKRGRPAQVRKPEPVAEVSSGREYSEVTGFVVDSDQDLIALELLDGGFSRKEITERLGAIIGTETKKGTVKQIAGLVSSVLTKMLDSGNFEVVESFQVVPVEKKPARGRRK